MPQTLLADNVSVMIGNRLECQNIFLMDSLSTLQCAFEPLSLSSVSDCVKPLAIPDALCLELRRESLPKGKLLPTLLAWKALKLHTPFTVSKH